MFGNEAVTARNPCGAECVPGRPHAVVLSPGVAVLQSGHVPPCPVPNLAVFGSSAPSPADTSAPPAGAGATPSPALSAGAAC